jgi:general secretion pathway protein C
MAIHTIVRRCFGVGILGLLALGAFFASQGILHVATASLTPDPRQLAAVPPSARIPPAPATSGPHATDAEPILARNAFDSATGPLDRAGISGVPEPPDEPDPLRAPECDGLRVLAIASSPDSDWSFAAFETARDGGRRVLRRRGGDVSGRTVAFVGRDRVWMKAGDRVCQSSMFRPPSSGTPVAPSGATAAQPNPTAIARVGPNQFDVDRSVLHKIIDNQAELLRDVRVVPLLEDGSVVGMRLTGVRKSGTLGALGLEEGDVLEKLNGFDMTNPEKMLEAYARLPSVEHWTLSLRRRGQETRLEYAVR